MECDCVCFDDGRNGVCGAIRAKLLKLGAEYKLRGSTVSQEPKL